MNNRWTVKEESNLLKLVSSGKTYKELSGGFNRSENALEMRVKKIVYDNISNNKPIEKIAQLLNLPKETIMQYHYSYKDHLSRENQHNGGSVLESDKLDKSDKSDKFNKLNNIIKIDKTDKIDKINTTHTGGGFEKIDKLELQNRKMKLMLENYLLKHKLSKILKSKDKTMNNDAIKALINK